MHTSINETLIQIPYRNTSCLYENEKHCWDARSMGLSSSKWKLMFFKGGENVDQRRRQTAFNSNAPDEIFIRHSLILFADR
ncbi:hypothetical protein QE152_g10831 [Popillia japonica]|uniref:Ycf15 n=1 Tax=Popillia japonica TaxID=7064 RepID=A0AAW1LTF1_POPJA